MSEVVNLLRNAVSLNVSPELAGYSGVTIYCGQNAEGDQIIYEAGDDTGNVLEIHNPFGSQQMADDVLSAIRGFQYQPYSATGALLNPAAEVGDGININGVYSGLFVRKTDYGALTTSELTAPMDEEIEHEFALESPEAREYTRFTSQVRSMLKVTADAVTAEVTARTEADDEINSTLAVQATEISAKVSKSGGDYSSFGWSLTDSAWSLFSNSTEVLRATSAGISVKGRIEAEEGYIGGENGFVIASDKIYKNLSTFGGSQSYGVYVGTDGIQLGQGFKVDSAGGLTASSASITGSITCTSLSVNGQTFSPSTVRSGISGGHRLGTAISGSGTSSDNLRCSYMNVSGSLRATTLTCTNLIVSGSQYRQIRIEVDGIVYRVLGLGG